MDHATFEEIARVRGRLERLEIHYIEQLHPELTETYVDQARRTLTSSYTAGDRDPRLLAELGLLECDADNDEAALSFLRDAAAYRVMHPRVYFELARINYEQMRAEARESPLTDTQVFDLVDTLEIAFTQSPALPEIYELLIKIWLQSEAVLLDKQLALLKQASDLFPRSFRLNYGIALLYAREGRVAETQRHIQRALGWIDDPKEQAKFLQLQNAVR